VAVPSLHHDPRDVALYAAIFLLAIVRALVAVDFGLTDDEAYYRLWALAPALSYLDHPPMVAWLIAAGQWVAGDSLLGVRLPAIVVSAIGPLILWRTAGNLLRSQTARHAVWVLLAMPLMAVGGVIMTPDVPSVLFWALALWALSELNVSRNANWWLAIGLFAGLGLLSKYTNAFLGAGILLWLALVPANRRWFSSWQLWAGGLLAVALTTPVLIWNAQHGYASFAKQFGRAVRGHGLTLLYLAELVGAFALLASPILAIAALIGFAHIVLSPVHRRDPRQALIVATVVPLVAYMLVHTLHSRVQANWPAPVYPAFAMCAASILSASAQRFRWLGIAALALGFASTAFIYTHAISPLAALGSVKDPTVQTRGWPDFAREMDDVRIEHGACRIVTSSYATTSQLAFYLKNQALVAQLDQPLRYVHLPPADRDMDCPALYVEIERRQSPALLRAHFDKMSEIGTFTRAAGGEVLARYRVLLGDARRR
jgi:4-amino-4-deoxy-L-arabinose transferase-like glycosyltransferase